MFKDIEFYKIIDDFSIRIIDMKSIFEEIQPLFPITIPIFAEPIASEYFMILCFSEFKRLLKIFFSFHPMIFFHLKNSFDIESKGISIIFSCIQKIYSFGSLSYFTFPILDISHLQKCIFIVGIPKKDRVDLFDGFIKFSQFLEFFDLIDKRIRYIGRHSINS